MNECGKFRNTSTTKCLIGFKNNYYVRVINPAGKNHAYKYHGRKSKPKPVVTINKRHILESLNKQTKHSKYYKLDNHNRLL